MQTASYLNATFAIETYILQKMMHKVDRAIFTMHQDYLPSTHKAMYCPKKPQLAQDEPEKDSSVSEDTVQVKRVFLMSSYSK